MAAVTFQDVLDAITTNAQKLDSVADLLKEKQDVIHKFLLGINDSQPSQDELMKAIQASHSIGANLDALKGTVAALDPSVVSTDVPAPTEDKPVVVGTVDPKSVAIPGSVAINVEPSPVVSE
jgi:hypothetical protein